jgi:hypothetical protein
MMTSRPADDADADARAGAGAGQAPRAGNGPVVVLSYAHSAAQRAQESLAAGTSLACTSGTGVIPLCAAAAATWQRIEGRDSMRMSRLAASTIRGLATAQVTVILAELGKTRWCELAAAAPAAARLFAQIFPETAFVCVHRRCPDTIAAALRASPWGLAGQGLTSYLLAHPGNDVAALAAYWADSTEDLLAFEKASPEAVRRLRCEDAGGVALTAVRDWLGLGRPSPQPALISMTAPETDPGKAPRPAEIPASLIPAPLLQRVNRLHAELGYPPVRA